MASGFITLRNGSNWSQRWSRYDVVLKMIMHELSEDGNEGKLKVWLRSLLPDEEDIECGWSFIRVSGDQEMILRLIDTRLMKEEYEQLFWATAKKVRHKTTDPDEAFLIDQLCLNYESSLKDDHVDPEPFNPETDDIEDFRIGPGWDEE